MGSGSFKARFAHLSQALVVLALAGCSAEAPPPAWDTAGAEERVRQAEASLRRFGEDRFEVLSFRAAAESTRVLEDDFHARSLLYSVPFHAHLRYVQDTGVEEMHVLPAHIGLPGWTPEGHRDEVMSALLLGPGLHSAGTEQDIDALAVFEDLEPGVRFRAFDVVR